MLKTAPFGMQKDKVRKGMICGNIFTTFLSLVRSRLILGLSPTLSGRSDPLIDAVLVLLNNAHRLRVKSLPLLVVLAEELMERGTDHVLLL